MYAATDDAYSIKHVYLLFQSSATAYPIIDGAMIHEMNSSDEINFACLSDRISDTLSRSTQP